MITEKQSQEQYAKLKQINKYAKSLGFTIYRVDCSFLINDEEHLLTDRTLNELPKKYYGKFN